MALSVSSVESVVRGLVDIIVSKTVRWKAASDLCTEEKAERKGNGALCKRVGVGGSARYCLPGRVQQPCGGGVRHDSAGELDGFGEPLLVDARLVAGVV
jgi:hypothetical protein